MSKTLLLYKSKYGSSKKYAMWLQEELNGDIINLKEKECKSFEIYDTIILVGGIYASGVSGMKYLKSNLSKLEDKKVVILAVGASPYDKNNLNHLIEQNLKDLNVEIPIFYARGAYDESTMTFVDRKLCKMLKKMVAKKGVSEMEPWEAALMESIGKTNDWTSKENLEEILTYLRG